MSSLKALLNTRKNMFDERDEAGNIPLQTLGLRIPAPMHQALKVRVAEQGVGCDDVLGHSLGGVSENECYV